MEEIWKDVKGEEGRYQVSNLGRVKSVKRVEICTQNRRSRFKPRVLKPAHDQSGYLHCNLSGRCCLIHRLVSLAFIPNPSNKPYVNHKDGNKENNCVENLEWCTQKENMVHAMRTGLHSGGLKGSASNFSKLDEISVRVIRDVYDNGSRDRKAIARYFKVSTDTISLIVKRKIWKHV